MIVHISGDVSKMTEAIKLQSELECRCRLCGGDLMMRQTLFVHFPRLLCQHVERFGYNASGVRKLAIAVDLEADCIDISSLDVGLNGLSDAAYAELPDSNGKSRKNGKKGEEGLAEEVQIELEGMDFSGAAIGAAALAAGSNDMQTVLAYLCESLGNDVGKKMDEERDEKMDGNDEESGERKAKAPQAEDRGKEEHHAESLQVDAESLQFLMEAGFGREQSVEALTACGNPFLST